MAQGPRLFRGNVMHCRLRPVRHAFVIPAFYIQLPVRDLASANCAVFSVDRYNILSFRTQDHGPRDGSPLLPWIEGILREHGLPDDGEIILQTFPRVLGYVFNPVSFWFCHDRAGALVAVLAEVRNTFGGYHNYLLHQGGAALHASDVLQSDKSFHVSPFNQVQGHYQFRFMLQGNRQQACIDYDDGQGPLLLTALSGTPFPWCTRTLLGAFLKMPFFTIGVIVRIHWHALRLWCKGVTFYGSSPNQR